VRTAEVDFVLETRGHEHVQQIIEALARAGFSARLHND
jgi:threonine dehydratase